MNIAKEDLVYQVEPNKKGVLGRISGPCADTIHSTRNGRKYSNELWERVFEDELVKEYFNCGGIFGELNHPVDREETDLEKVAICMPKPPVKDSNGQLIGEWDILDTPNGRIAKCLFDYGYKLGISSRGSGDTFTDYDGNESVDPDTYDFKAFDLVYLPAVKAARLSPIKESLDTNAVKLKKALNEALEKATDEERKIMETTLNSLDIDYSETDEVKETQEKTIPEKDVHKEDSASDLAADDDGAKMIKELQEALKAQSSLEKQVQSLQSQLSVCYTKEGRYSGALSTAKNELLQAKADNEKLSHRIESLSESLKKAKETIESRNQRINSLQEKLMTYKSQTKTLNESVSAKDSEMSTLADKVQSLTESYEKTCKDLRRENSRLQESLQEMQKDSQIAKSQSSAKLSQAQLLVEKYKTIAKTAVDKYIKLQATRLGVDATEIKNKLTENYSFNDIDRVCEGLQKYKLTVNSLPFSIRSDSPKPSVKMSIKESKEAFRPINDDGFDADDDIDASFFNIHS